MADNENDTEERVDVKITMTGKNNSGFSAKHVNIYKNVRRSDFFKMQQFGTKALGELGLQLVAGKQQS